MELILKEVNLSDCLPYCGSIGRDGGCRDSSRWVVNSKTKAHIEKIMRSIQEQGMVNPLWVLEHNSKYKIIRGSARAVACKELSIQKVKVLVVPLGMSRQTAEALFKQVEYKQVKGFE